MKKIAIAVLAALMLSGCSDQKAQEKALLDEVIKVHDKVMQADEQLMKNKMKLDTLLKQSNLPERDTAVLLHDRLVVVDNGMDKWMNKFIPDYKGKTEVETIAYLDNQKKQIVGIDSLFKKVIDESNRYLLKVKAK